MTVSLKVFLSKSRAINSISINIAKLATANQDYLSDRFVKAFIKISCNNISINNAKLWQS